MNKTINPETLICKAEDKHPKANFKYDIHMVDHMTDFGISCSTTVKVSKGITSVTLKTTDFDISTYDTLCKILESALEYMEKECNVIF